MSAQFETISGPTAVERVPSQASKPSRILVVEDDRAIRHLSTKLLLQSGYQVDAAEDGAAAWEALQDNSYDLLVTDHQMPKVSGVELIEKLRSARMSLPVILVSGALPLEELTRKPWLQLDAKLPKPYSCEDFLGTVKEVLRTTNGAREPIAPPPNRQSQPLAAGLRM